MPIIWLNLMPLDGNKRIAAAVSEVFLLLNEAQLNATNEEIVTLFLSIAANALGRADVERFFNQKVVCNDSGEAAPK